MAAYTTLIATGTSAANATFTVPAGAAHQLVLIDGTGANDSITVEVSYDGGTNFTAAYDDNNNAVALAGANATLARNPILVMGPMFGRVSRAANQSANIGCALVQTVINY